MGKEKEYIKMDDILSKSNIRTEINDSEIVGLMRSIRSNGLLEPIGVTPTKDSKGKFLISYGHRRFVALKKLGYTKLEVGKEIIINEEADSRTSFFNNMSENENRLDISPIELGSSVVKAKEKYGMSVAEISAATGINKTRLENAYNVFLNTPDEFKPYITSKDGAVARQKSGISPTLANTISRIFTSRNNIKKIYEYAKTHRMSPKEVRIVETLMQSGLSVEDALKERENCVIKNISLPINNEVFEKLQSRKFYYFNTLSDYIRAIVSGKIEPEKNLIYFAKKQGRGD